MAIYEVLKNIMEAQRLSVADVARVCDLPDSTVRGIISRKQKTVALEVAFKLSNGLRVSLEKLNGMPEPQTKEKAPSLSDEAQRLARDYDSLDKWGQQAVRDLLDNELARMGWQEEPETKVIPLFGNSFAAGVAEPDMGNAWEPYNVEASSRADFAIKINGDSMEPYLHDGSIALGKRGNPENGEVGAFLLDGEFLCKQYCQDHLGNVHLLSLNRARADADLTICHDSGRTLLCFGKILMDKVPLPGV